MAKMAKREMIFLAAAVISIFTNVNQYIGNTKEQAGAEAALLEKQADLDKMQAGNAALMSVSLQGFLQTYNAHVNELRLTADAFEKAKVAKGSNIPGSNAAVALTRAQSDLNIATDIFTDFMDRWRDVAQSLGPMLDGNVAQLENSRRENNTDEVSAMAHRIVRSAPDLATPLRVALDKLKPSSKEKK